MGEIRQKVMELIESEVRALHVESGGKFGVENIAVLRRDVTLREFLMSAPVDKDIEKVLTRLVYGLWIEKQDLVSYILEMMNTYNVDRKLIYEDGRWRWEEKVVDEPKPNIVRIAE